MDVNGTKFHLLHGRDDWALCYEPDQPDSLGERWAEALPTRLEWDDASQSLRLTREIPRLRRASRAAPLALAQRRGAGRDRYGNWYWIDSSERGLRFLPVAGRESVPYWSAADLEAGCEPGEDGGFVACRPAAPPDLLLRGLAVTTHHYLVVGSVTQHGLLLFDLHRGGTPNLLRWPDDVPFVPWDLAATPDGGLLVLDRVNLTYWRLDSDFRLIAERDEDEALPFQPREPRSPRNVQPGAIHPRGYRLDLASPPEPLSPISIEPGPEGHVLILDTDLDPDDPRPYSLVYEYHGETRVATYSMEEVIEAIDLSIGEGVVRRFSIVGHDFAYLDPRQDESDPGRAIRRCRCNGDEPAPDDEPQGPPPLLYVAEQAGQQAWAFTLDRDEQRLIPEQEFLPLRRWEGKALVTAGDYVYYDFADRWVRLYPYTECHYAGSATLTTPLTFGVTDEGTLLSELPGRPFDGGLPGTVWHRLFLDAQLPAGTRIEVRARAADDPLLLAQSGWIDQPSPYLRANGAELPYYDPWADLAPTDPLRERTGTWELLFQRVEGRYLQLELTLLGTGRSTPALRALRAWYPRFSYLENYLPAVYREDPVSASFFDRWLANFEGTYTGLEEQIEHAAALFDPRTAPAEALDWLGCWLGVVLDPLWPEARRRFFIRHADRLYRLRGTLAGLEIALHLYLDERVDERIFDPACRGDGYVRIVENFLTRGIGGLAYGDPTDEGRRELRPLTREDVVANAHRFVVLTPHDLTEEQETMVARIVELERPAHTSFELKRYWDLFRVGEARLGLDTQLGESSRFTAFCLGASYLPDHFLQPPYPFDVSDRLVVERDRLGALPPL